MRLPIPVILLCLVSVACAGASVETRATTTSIDTTNSSVSQTTTTESVPTTTSTSTPPGPPVAWIAPSGVPVAVTAVNGEQIEVLTPCGSSEVLDEGVPVYEVDIVLDPGHGGPVDTGAVAPTGLTEKEVNLKVGLEAAEMLATRGFGVVLTRTGDYPIPIRTRVEYAHLMEARALVSIHHNGPTAPASDIPGVEIFVQQDSTESQRLGGLLYDASMKALGAFDVDWDRSSDAGVMTVLNSDGEDAYGMVRLPEIPSALVELGYIVNRAEAELYQTPDYAPAAAEALADAIESFLTSSDQGAALVEGRIFDPNRGVGRDQCVEPELELALYPDVVEVDVDANDSGYSFAATISSPYDSPNRYADAFRVIGDDGIVYGVRELTHDHANEQPFTRNLGPLEIPDTVSTVTVEARDQVYGWGGAVVEASLP